jgi:uncharacterized protein
LVTGVEYLLIFVAAIAAGAVNALAGGGTLITFPTLTFVGLPAISANVTNTVALLPGYVGGILAQAKDLIGQRKRLLMFVPAGLLGGLLGGFLLLNTGEKLFRELVPYLILLACGLLALQDPLRRWLSHRLAETGRRYPSELWAILPVGLAAVYGGYFGAGLSVIILAVLGLVIDDNLTRLNALKQAISLSANLAAALFFVFSGQVVWAAALVMMVGALTGGLLGGRLARRIKPASLRWLIISIGVAVAAIYLIKSGYN